MPLPSPRKGEKKQAFISRCMSFMHGENEKRGAAQKRSQKQMAGICYSQWDKVHGENKKKE